MTVTATFTGIAAKKGLEKLLADIYAMAKGETQRRILRWRARKQMADIYKKLRNVRLVKTIWQVEKEVDLTKFYHPSKLRLVNTLDQPKTINDLAELDYAGNILVQGTVGQGKSIFLRHLTSWELMKGKAIPVFIELRRIKEGNSLTRQILDELELLGMDMDEETFRFFAEQGRATLFLDAFDEVKESQRSQLVTEIETFAKRYEKLRIVVSSRPGSGIAQSPFLRVYELCPLQGDEYVEVVHRMAQDDETAGRVLKGVKGSQIVPLLTTPLMVALLMVRYHIDQSIPENSVAFFGELFSLLLRRHDKSKAGYFRPRKSKQSDSVIQEVFDGICYLTKRSGEGVYTLDQLRSHTKESLNIANHKADPDKVLEDVIEITCLILEEGGECRFIHKSVQEYHAASFVRRQPDAAASQFYSAMLLWNHAWSQELQFLQQMDKYRFTKWFLIPDMVRLLKVSADEIPSSFQVSNEQALELWGEVWLLVHVPLSTQPSQFGWQLRPRESFSFPMPVPFFPVILDSLPQIAEAVLAGNIKAETTTIHGFSHFVDTRELVSKGFLSRHVYDEFGPALSRVFDELREAGEYVSHVETTRAVFSF